VGQLQQHPGAIANGGELKRGLVEAHALLISQALHRVLGGAESPEGGLVRVACGGRSDPMMRQLGQMRVELWSEEIFYGECQLAVLLEPD